MSNKICMTLLLGDQNTSLNIIRTRLPKLSYHDTLIPSLTIIFEVYYNNNISYLIIYLFLIGNIPMMKTMHSNFQLSCAVMSGGGNSLSKFYPSSTRVGQDTPTVETLCSILCLVVLLRHSGISTP